MHANPWLAGSCLTAAGVLCLFQLVLRRHVTRTRRTLRYELAVPSSVHYVQATMQLCIYAYWGWYWREVYHYMPLIGVQLVFAYVLDMLVCWARRDTWVLGFGPWPIILSTNLFLWFKDDWFFLQFVLVSTGVHRSARGCSRLGASYVKGEGTAVNYARVIESFEKACRGEHATSCSNVAIMYRRGIGGRQDEALARQRFAQACNLGLQSACQGGKSPAVVSPAVDPEASSRGGTEAASRRF